MSKSLNLKVCSMWNFDVPFLFQLCAGPEIWRCLLFRRLSRHWRGGRGSFTRDEPAQSARSPPNKIVMEIGRPSKGAHCLKDMTLFGQIESVSESK